MQAVEHTHQVEEVLQFMARSGLEAVPKEVKSRKLQENIPTLNKNESLHGVSVLQQCIVASELANTSAVSVHATACFKLEGERSEWPDVVPADVEPDQWDYVEPTPMGVCTLHDCTEIEAGLVVHWLNALNDADSEFSRYREPLRHPFPVRRCRLSVRRGTLGAQRRRLR